jgi:DNA repair protein RecO (recombination protein O)
VTERLKLRAVVLRTVDHGESDRVVTLLARGHGKLAAFARGARNSKKRFGGGLEPFTLVAAELSGRGGADRLLRLESVSPERAFHRLRGDLARIACAAYAVELARELTRDHEAHDDLFDLLVAYLGALDEAPAAPATLRAFELGALAAAGYQPRLDACARCCARQAPPGRLVLSAAGLAALRRLQHGGLAAGAAPLEAAAGRESREALERFLTHLLGHRLQARKFLDEVGPLLSG